MLCKTVVDYLSWNSCLTANCEAKRRSDVAYSTSAGLRPGTRTGLLPDSPLLRAARAALTALLGPLPLRQKWGQWSE